MLFFRSMIRWRYLLESILTPFLAFVGLYFAATLLLLLPASSLLHSADRQTVGQWIGLVAAIVANVLCVRLLDHGSFDIGIVRRPASIALGLAKGVAVAAILIGGADALIIVSTGFRHAPGNGLDPGQLILLFLPAAAAEELVFRGYVLQRLARVSFAGAMLFTSLLFAVAHIGNTSVGPIALLNIFLAGVVLSLAWRWTGSLWVPIGTHIAWNVLSGPVLGHEVSGLVLSRTLLTAVDPGPEFLTGGTFGIEASIWMTLGEVATIAFLAIRIRAAAAALAQPASRDGAAAAPLPDSQGKAFPNEDIETT